MCGISSVFRTRMGTSSSMDRTNPDMSRLVHEWENVLQQLGNSSCEQFADIDSAYNISR